MFGGQRGSHTVGILPVLCGMGRRNLSCLPVLFIPDTDNIASVSPFWFLLFCFHQVLSAQRDQINSNVGSFCLTFGRVALTPQPQHVCRWSGIFCCHDHNQCTERVYLPQFEPNFCTRNVSDCSASIVSGLSHKIIVRLLLILHHGS